MGLLNKITEVNNFRDLLDVKTRVDKGKLEHGHTGTHQSLMNTFRKNPL